jgi:long-chain-fatty-acid--[acyl-carrier-protein] ligase
MVSLGGLEEEILHFASVKGLLLLGKSNAPLALCAKQNDIDKTELILFSTFPILKEEVNAHFKDAGWGRIIKISEVIQIDEIPLTGVGKTDYRFLSETYLSS